MPKKKKPQKKSGNLYEYSCVKALKKKKKKKQLLYQHNKHQITKYTGNQTQL